jgi:hypothetical protein
VLAPRLAVIGHHNDRRVVGEAELADRIDQLLDPRIAERDLVVVLLLQALDARQRRRELLVRHVRRVRLEQVRPQREVFLARGGLAQPFDHLGNDARRRDVLVRLGDRARAFVRPFGEAAADAPVGREIECEKMAIGFQPAAASVSK